MKHVLSSFAVAVVLFSSASSRAEGGEEPKVEAKIDTVVGLTGDQLGAVHVDALVRSVIVEGRVRVSPNLDLKLYVPYTSASIRIDGQSETHGSLGNVGLSITRWFPLQTGTAVGGTLLFTAPTASGDPLSTDADKRTKAGLGEFSNRIRSYEEDEFFTVRRASIVPRIDVVHRSEGWAYSGYVKVPFMIRAGGEDYEPYANADVRGLTVEAVFAAQILRQFGEAEGTRGLAAAFGVRAFVTAIFSDPLDDPALPSQKKSQLAGEFVGKFRFGPVLLNLGMLVPLAGRANEAYAKQHAYRIAIGANF